MEIVQCPHCKTRMVPSADGKCASCSIDIHSPPLMTPDESIDQNFPPKSNGLVTLLILVGAASGLFSFAQLLQLLGVFGIGFSAIGVFLTCMTAVVLIVCFKHAFS